MTKMKDHNTQPKHFLWGLQLAYAYGTETNCVAVLQVTQKMFQKRLFQALQLTANLLPDVVSQHDDMALLALFPFTQAAVCSA